MARPKAPPAPPASPDEVEQQFYEALQRADLDQLMAVWADDDDVVCVHPGGPRVVGPVAVRAAFEAIFGNGAIDVHPERVRRLHHHGCEIHSVLEQVRVMTDEGARTGWVVATNVFVKTAQGWRLAAHHASPGMPHDVDELVEAGSTLH